MPACLATQQNGDGLDKPGSHKPRACHGHRRLQDHRTGCKQLQTGQHRRSAAHGNAGFFPEWLATRCLLARKHGCLLAQRILLSKNELIAQAAHALEALLTQNLHLGKGNAAGCASNPREAKILLKI